MKWKLLIVVGAVLLACQAGAEEQPGLKTRTDRENYSNGVTIARSLKQQGGEVNLDVVVKGMMDELRGENLLMTEEAIRNTLSALQNEKVLRQKQAAINRDENKAAVSGTIMNTISAGRDDDPGVQQQQERPAKTIEQVDQDGLLAKKEATRTTTRNSKVGRDDYYGTRRKQVRSEQQLVKGDQAASSGSSWSRRSQDELRMKTIRVELKARADSGEIIQNDPREQVPGADK